LLIILPNCKFIILLFDYLEEFRVLSPDELAARELSQTRLAQALKEQASYWKQRGKHKAIKEGDANTQFFHAHATQRLRRNQIKVVEVDGVQITSHDGKVLALTNYFRGVLGTPGNSTLMFDLQALYSGRATASAAQSDKFTATEALTAVRSMNRCSAPGPDGFGTGFYAAAWQTIQSEVLAFLDGFHSEDIDLQRINRSYMVLLPKKPGAVAVDCFRPICLQNCSVKIAAKILTTRLQREIAELVALEQTGFVKGRSIAENFVHAAELVQVCHKRKAPTLVLKLDFAKAFDTVNWNFLLTVLQVRGFDVKWRNWVQKTPPILSHCSSGKWLPWPLDPVCAWASAR